MKLHHAAWALALLVPMTPTTLSAEVEGGGCSEGFDNAATLGTRGWIFRNNSQPVGSTDWFQGVAARFPAQAGAANSYLSADKDNAGPGFPVVSNWAITPAMAFQPGVSLSFHSRSAGGTGSAADRLQVLYCQRSPGVSCKHPGSGSGSMNNYNELLWINPNSMIGGYPTSWAAFSVGAGQGLPTSGNGRIAFRYYTLWQNPNDWGSTIGIDTLSLSVSAPCALTETLFYDGMESN